MMEIADFTQIGKMKPFTPNDCLVGHGCLAQMARTAGTNAESILARIGSGARQANLLLLSEPQKMGSRTALVSAKITVHESRPRHETANGRHE